MEKKKPELVFIKFNMSLRYRTRGVIIGKNNQGEFNRMLILYTEDFGKLKLFGKSIRKESSKLRFGIEPFSLIEVEFIEGRTRKTLTDVKIINSYSTINKNIEKIALGNKIMENLNDLIKGEEKDLKIWNLVEKTFNRINDSNKGFIIYQYFFWTLISILGYKPELYYCSQCRRDINSKNLTLSPEDGGLICEFCFSKESSFSVEEGTVKVIRVILGLKEGVFKNIKLNSHDEKLLWEVSQKYLSLSIPIRK